MLTIGKGWILIGAALWLLTGCSADHHSEKVMTMSPKDMDSPVLAVDVTDQGTMKITGLQGIRPLGDAGEKQVVLVGEAFVARNGLPLGGKQLPRELSLPSQRPLIALVKGSAEALLNQERDMGPWLPELRLLDDLIQSFHSYRDHGPRDRFLPSVTPAGDSGQVLVQTAVMRGDKPDAWYTREEMQLLSCLDGHQGIGALPVKELSGLHRMDCRVQWSGNGDLKSPRLHAKVTVVLNDGPALDSGGRVSAEEALEQRLTELLRRQQAQRIDPLDIGRVINSQYRGVWTADRWRAALARADIRVDVRITS